MASTSLLSSHKSSDSGLRIHLHPLVLLTISDYITRHTLRQYRTPIVGALLGQQNGRDITLEHAFECELVQNNNQVRLHETWFKDRLQQYKDVHLAPVLELMGWFTTAPVTGPESVHVPLHQQVLHIYNETAVLLAFHPASVLEGAAVGGKLPLTIYESVYESGENADRGMDIDGQEAPLDLKFRELPYSVDTGEAEMISVDFVARGGGNATSVDGTVKKGQASQAPVGQVDAKGKATEKESKAIDDSSLLSPEDEELVASLTARANAVKMLHSRIRLLKDYLTSLPPSYLTSPPPANTTTIIPNNDDENTNESTPQPASPPTSQSQLSHPLLRSILALLSRLPLLFAPSAQDTLAEKSDVELVSLLGALGRSAKEVREVGRKFGVVEAARAVGRKDGWGGGGDFGGSNGGGEFDVEGGYGEYVF